MRIIKLSKEVNGFDSVGACINFFEYVVPWQKGLFHIIGEGNHIAADGLKEGELVIFSYSGQIICLAKTIQLVIDKNGSASGVIINSDTKKIFKIPPKLKDLEILLHSKGYTSQIVRTRGWNKIDSIYEPIVIDFLIKHDWAEFKQ